MEQKYEATVDSSITSTKVRRPIENQVIRSRSWLCPRSISWLLYLGQTDLTKYRIGPSLCIGGYRRMAALATVQWNTLALSCFNCISFAQSLVNGKLKLTLNTLKMKGNVLEYELIDDDQSLKTSKTEKKGKKGTLKDQCFISNLYLYLNY